MVTLFKAPGYQSPETLAPPVLFDRSLLRRRRDRAAAGFDGYAFVLEAVTATVLERLMAIQRPFKHVLDLGCHTGQFAAQARAARLPFAERIVQCDLSHTMASHARSGTGRPSVVADEERLPFAEERFDLVVSLLSLHHVNDLPGAFIQINRVLKPDGLFIAALFGGETLMELRRSLAGAEAEHHGEEDVPHRVSPFVDVRDAGSLLQRARFALPVADAARLDVTYATPLNLMADLRGMGETNVLFAGARRPLRRQSLMRACALYQEGHTLASGKVPATFEIITVTGWAPHESQQKPLAPGSARTRLAEALNTQERSAGERPDGSSDPGER